MNESVSSRRGFLKTAGFLAGSATVAPSLMASEIQTNNAQSIFNAYKHNKIGTITQLKKDGEIDFFYPDASSMCKAVYVNNEIKAFNIICTHKGCPTIYNKDKHEFECPCHFTKYDAAKDGQMIIGHATGKLPSVILEVRGDDIYAVGFDGLIFGRINNNIG